MKLNRTGSNWNELERNKINENWDIIEGSYNDVVGQITDEVVGHLIDSAKLNWKEPVESEADLPKDAEVGETRMVRESVDGVSHVYRYNGTEWELIQEIDATLVNEVDRRLTAQLADKAQQTDLDRLDRRLTAQLADEVYQRQSEISYLNTNKVSKPELSLKLDSKVDKGGSGQVTWGMLDQNTKEQILGNTPPAVVGKDSVGTENIVDNSVTLEKMTDSAIDGVRKSTFSNMFKLSNIETSLQMVTGSVIQINHLGQIKSLSRFEPTYQVLNIVEGRKYYARFRGNVRLSNFHIYFEDGTRQVVPIDSGNSVLLTANKTGLATVGFQLSEGTNVVRKNQIMIDLTRAFGEGNEPDKEKVESILECFDDGWVSDTVSVGFIQNTLLRQDRGENESNVNDVFLPSGIFKVISNSPDKEYLYYDTVNSIVYALDATVPTAEQNVIYASYDLGRTWKIVYVSDDGRSIRRLYTLRSGYHLVNPNSATVRRLSPDFSSESEFTDFNIFATLNDALGIAEIGTDIFYAEYGTSQQNYRILKSTDDGVTWTVSHDGTDVRHWHSIQRDPYTNYIWACAGDTNEQSRIVVSKDRGDTWEVVYGGTQQARSCGLVFFEDFILWGMDTAGIKPQVMKLDRNTGDVTVVGDVPYGATTLGHSKTIDGLAMGWARIEANNEQRDNTVLWVSDGESIEVMQKFRVNPNATIGGFTRGSMIDDKNRWFAGATEINPSGLTGYALPLGVL